MNAALYPGEIVYDASNFHTLLGNGREVWAAGEKRLLSRVPPKPGHNPREYSTPFEDAFKTIPRSEWSARLKEQLERKARISDCQNFPPHNQGSNPTCWANGPAHAATTQRVLQGLPYIELSADSVALVGSSGHVGGSEHDAIEWATKYGWCSTKVWPNNDADKSKLHDEKCNEDRKHHKPLEWIDLGGHFDNYMTAALFGWPMAVAYNDWSHVVMLCDGVEIESGRFGLRIRNNWNGWGAANEYGEKGYAVFSEHGGAHSCPSSGFALRQMTSDAN